MQGKRPDIPEFFSLCDQHTSKDGVLQDRDFNPITHIITAL